MYLIGIDFSLNSPGICIEKDNKLIFYGGIREDTHLRKIDIKCINLIKEITDCNIFMIPAKEKIEVYSEQEILDLKDAVILTNIINDILYKEIDSPENCIIGIEGFSYNSFGSSQSRIYGYGFILRYVLMQLGYKFEIISPKSIKKTAGKGNYNKNQMIEAFLENSINDNNLKMNNLRLAIINNINDFKDTKKYLKPLEDMIDAYWAMKSLK